MELAKREALNSATRLELFYAFREFLNELPAKRKKWSSIFRHPALKLEDSCGMSGCIGGWASVFFKTKYALLDVTLEQVFEITHEESSFVCYGYSWDKYNEPDCGNLEDFSEAMRRFNKLIAHYEFLEGKVPEPEQYIEPTDSVINLNSI